jgi:hypothetical protein
MTGEKDGGMTGKKYGGAIEKKRRDVREGEGMTAQIAC